MTDKKGNKIYTKQQINNLKTQFGVGDVDSDGNVSGQKKINNAVKKFDGMRHMLLVLVLLYMLNLTVI